MFCWWENSGSLFSPWHQHPHHFLCVESHTGFLWNRNAAAQSGLWLLFIHKSRNVTHTPASLATAEGEMEGSQQLAGPWEARGGGDWRLSYATFIPFIRGQEKTEDCHDPCSWCFTETFLNIFLEGDLGAFPWVHNRITFPFLQMIVTQASVCLGVPWAMRTNLYVNTMGYFSLSLPRVTPHQQRAELWAYQDGRACDMAFPLSCPPPPIPYSNAVPWPWHILL